MARQLPAPADKITVLLDETGDQPAVIVTAARADLTRRIVCECHDLAGRHGATIEFRTERGMEMIRA